MDAQVKQIASFLKNPSPGARLQAIKIFAGLSKDENIANICSELELGKDFVRMLGTSSAEGQKHAMTVLINMSAFRAFRNHLYDCKGICDVCLDNMRSKECTFKHLITLFFINFTQENKGQLLLCQTGEKIEGLHIKRLIVIFSRNARSENYSRISDVLQNVTQCVPGRDVVVDMAQTLVQVLQYAEPSTCRTVLASIQNLCLQTSTHEKLLAPETGLLVQMGLFLCGPAEELDDEDFAEVMKDISKHMDIDKERHPDEEVRESCLDILLLLMTDKEQRKYVRGTGFYYILREYDKWEQSDKLKDKVDELVQFFQRKDVPEAADGKPMDTSTLPPAEEIQRFEHYEGELKPLSRPNKVMIEDEEEKATIESLTEGLNSVKVETKYPEMDEVD